VPTPSVSGGSGMDAQEQSVSIPAKRMNGVSASSVTRRVSGAFASAMDASVAIPAATPAMPIPTVTQGAVTPPDIAVTATPTVPMPDMSAVKEKAASIPGAAGAKRGSLETPWKQAKEEKNASPASITIQNAYFQAEDCTTLFDFMRMIMHVTHNPQEAAI
jgi:hypothetical protein